MKLIEHIQLHFRAAKCIRIQFLFLLFLFPITSSAQVDKEAYIDSLKKVISETKDDKEKVDAYLRWDEEIFRDDRELDYELNKKVMSICKRRVEQSDSSSSYYFFHKLSTAYNQLAFVCQDRGDMEMAISYLNEARKISKRIKDDLGVAESLVHIGQIYGMQDQPLVALGYYKDAKFYSQIPEKAENTKVYSYKSMQANITGAIASGYTELYYYSEGQEKKQYLDSALAYLYSVIDKTERLLELNDSQIQLNRNHEYLAEFYSVMGTVQLASGNQNYALKYSDKALSLARELGYPLTIANALDLKASCYFEKGDVKQAIALASESSELIQEIGDFSQIVDNSMLLHRFYKADNQFKLALENYERYIQYKDSLSNLSNEKALIQNDYRTQYEKKALSDSLNFISEKRIKDEVITKQEMKLDKERSQKIGLFLLSALLVLIVVLVLRGSQQKKRVNKIISFQKKKVEAHRKKIVDSITYAEKIQKALLTSTSELKTVFPGAVNLNMPKDIVSGDFFWCHQEGDTSYLALSDCTGHGVPGAFMSIIGANLLKEVILKKKDSNLGEILFELDKELIETLSQYDEAATADGMDIGIIKVNHTTRNIEFAGANQNLFIINEQGTNIIKGELRSVGGWVRKRSRLPNFTVKSFSMEGLKGIYLATDGLEDQLGGPNNVKFGRDTFVSLISEMGNSPDMDVIRKAFDEWKGSNEQLDDISVIGIGL